MSLDTNNTREYVLEQGGWIQNLAQALPNNVRENNSPESINVANNNTCRICLGIHTTSHPLYQRCSCAQYHNDCILNWIKYRPNFTCEICGERFRGIRKERRKFTIATFKNYRFIEIGIQCILSFLLWFLMIKISNFNHCLNKSPYLNCKLQCSNFPGIYNYTLAINIVISTSIFINILILTFFRKETGIDVITYKWYMLISGNRRPIMINNQNDVYENNRVLIV
tara:strand:+ start:1897 stop:2571 length:675 start_codon:yes stop_codon:yes gene_type:complete